MPRLIGATQAVTSGTQAETITTFNSSGTLTTQPRTTSLQYLVVAGGGAGGDTGGGGGLSDFGRNPTPKDKTLIQERMSLLRSIGDVEMDSKTLDLVEKTYKNLEKLANGEGLSSKRR